MKPYVDVLTGAETPIDADLVGAFPEDALSEADALASVGDYHETPAEALASKPE